MPLLCLLAVLHIEHVSFVLKTCAKVIALKGKDFNESFVNGGVNLFRNNHKVIKRRSNEIMTLIPPHISRQ